MNNNLVNPEVFNITFETKLRVRYAETDKMGVVYYGNYFTWLEVARTEVLRTIGYPYLELENNGVFLPVVEANSKYIHPLFYDDEILIKTKITELSYYKITFSYEIYKCPDLLLCNKAKTIHAFIDNNKKLIKKNNEHINKIFQLLESYSKNYNC